MGGAKELMLTEMWWKVRTKQSGELAWTPHAVCSTSSSSTATLLFRKKSKGSLNTSRLSFRNPLIAW